MMRDRSLWQLKAGRVQVLVATDVASRGLDLPGIDHVVNFDLPKDAESYVHRIGRTGRIGNKGVATSLVGPNEKALKEIVELVKGSREDEEAAPLPDWLLAQV